MARPKKLPTIINEAEIQALTAQANSRYVTGHRNRVMMQLMLSIGLRLAEVVNLRWDDIDFLSEVLMIREGKGMKDRTLFIKDNNWRGVDDKTALQEWKERQAEELGELPEYVFTTMSANSSGNQLNDRYVQAMIRRYSKRAGINKKISPHTLRHTFATRLYKHTKDIAVVQKALGHSDLSTTMVYVHLVSSDVEKALSNVKDEK
ncbi:integrase [Aliifodinibius salipaludis]|uniref:Integrase n=1 Tax=Fodinibius salipaludis TaxID=2032627 RepID=A0A2A2GEU5_9BACT|nr:tyrosine-type recombinase/integrase [Aliifodinibius salipaludis]PAU95385.1 integrase [Aliifodinibius salipaludis]